MTCKKRKSSRYRKPKPGDYFYLPDDVRKKAEALLDRYPKLLKVRDSYEKKFNSWKSKLTEVSGDNWKEKTMEMYSLSFEFDDYDKGMGTSYDGVRSSPTNAIAKPTEMLAENHIDAFNDKVVSCRNEIEKNAEESELNYNDVKNQITVVQKAIKAAVKDANPGGDRSFFEDMLTRNILDSIPREKLRETFKKEYGRAFSNDSLNKYRDRACYYVAVYLGWYRDEHDLVDY